MRSGSRPEERPSARNATGRDAATPQEDAAGGSARPVDSGSAPVAEGSAPAADGSAAPVAEDSTPATDGDSAPAAPGKRRARLQALAGMTVRGSDGATAGRVRDIYLHDATGQLAAITVVRRQLSSGAVLIPAAAIAELPAAHAPGEAPANEDAAGGNRARRAADRKARRSPRAPSIRLRIEAAATRNGTPPPATGHATPQELRAAAAALGVDEASAA